MKKSFSLKTIMSVSCVTLFCAITNAASAQPDLVINKLDTRVSSGGCSFNEALASGTVAIKNIGTETAKLKVTELVTLRSMLAVYVPENIDMIAKIKERDSLKPLDQEGLFFEVAKGVVKRGRYFSSLGEVGSLDAVGSSNNRRNRVATIQRSLKKLGFDPQGVDGVIGSNTRAAIRAWQKKKGYPVSGLLTSAQEKALVSEAGLSYTPSNAVGANGTTKVTLYAIVDPYNLIDESNEANNIEKFEVTIDCSN